MGAWHFEITLLPEIGLVKFHGEIPEMIEEFRKLTADVDLSEIPDRNYWDGIDIFQDVLPAAKIIFSNVAFESNYLIVLGTITGNNISLRADEVSFEFDLRELDLEVLEEIMRLARKFECKIVAGDQGKVVDPQVPQVAQLIKESDALKFVMNPREFIRKFKKT